MADPAKQSHQRRQSHADQVRDSTRSTADTRSPQKDRRFGPISLEGDPEIGKRASLAG